MSSMILVKEGSHRIVNNFLQELNQIVQFKLSNVGFLRTKKFSFFTSDIEIKECATRT